jgi:hypothetical protein
MQDVQGTHAHSARRYSRQGGATSHDVPFSMSTGVLMGAILTTCTIHKISAPDELSDFQAQIEALLVTTSLCWR